MNPGHYGRQVAAIHVTALNDGLLPATLDLVLNGDRTELETLERLARRGEPPAITVNGFLVSTGSSRCLVDAGFGGSRGPDFGKIIDNLSRIGLSPDDVDDVILTHMHADHANGLIGPDGRRVFGRATVHVAAEEISFWRDPDRVGAAPARSVAAVDTARQVLELYADRIRPFSAGEILPAIEAVPEPGHTPGHSGFLVGTGGERLLIWGDIVHLPAVQFPKPDAALVFDVDPQTACATRRRIMAWAADEGFPVAGMHLDFPGFGFVARDGDGFRYIPAQWQP